MIPPYEASGTLPPGVHWATWQEIVDTFGSTVHRKRLLGGLAAALKSLRTAGCKAVFLDGSFVTDKAEPEDFDGCWDPSGVDPNLLDPILLVFDTGRRTQKAKYRGELFPSSAEADAAGRTFVEFFQQDRDGNTKGIIGIDLQKVET